MPVNNWINIIETGEFRYLSKYGKICKRAHAVYDRIQDEIIDTFGVSDEFLMIRRAEIDAELLRCEIVETGDRTRQIFVDLAEQEIEERQKKMTKADVVESVIWIEKELGLKINIKEITVFEYYKYMEFIQKQIKAKANNNVR